MLWPLRGQASLRRLRVASPLGRKQPIRPPGLWGVGKQCLDRGGALRPDPTAVKELSGDAPRNREMNSAERARTPDEELRPPRPRPVSPDPDRSPAPADKSVKSYQITEDGYFIPWLPSPNSCLTPRSFPS